MSDHPESDTIVEEGLAVRLTWKDGVSTPFAEGAATLVAATGRLLVGSGHPVRTDGPSGAVRSQDIREVISQDGAA